MRVAIMHDLLWCRFGLITTRNALNIRKINFTVVCYETNLCCHWREASIVDPSIARYGHELLTISCYSRKRSWTIHIQLLVVTRCNLNCAIKRARNNYSTWQWIKFCAYSWCFMDWLVGRLAHCMGHPEVICLKVCADINATWSGRNGKLVSSKIPSCI